MTSLGKGRKPKKVVEEEEKVKEEEKTSEIQQDLKSIEEEKDKLVEEEIVPSKEEKVPIIQPLKKEAEEEILEERFYKIPLGRALVAAKFDRTNRAVKLVRKFLTRHFKPEILKIEPELNEFLWKRGQQKPPRHIKVRATKDREGVVTAYLVKE